LPDTICIFKPSVIRNPALGPAAILAGYASGDAGVDLIRNVAARVVAGRSLLIFPEGTRTLSGVALNPLKPGFALIAARAQVPVRLLVIRAPRDLIPKGFPWWRIPVFPAHVEIALLGELDTAGATRAAELTARATQQLSAALVSS
jgi:1-acyl-sn-glycerol-3-phosphate acyltransferase